MQYMAQQAEREKHLQLVRAVVAGANQFREDWPRDVYTSSLHKLLFISSLGVMITHA